MFQEWDKKRMLSFSFRFCLWFIRQKSGALNRFGKNLIDKVMIEILMERITYLSLSNPRIILDFKIEKKSKNWIGKFYYNDSFCRNTFKERRTFNHVGRNDSGNNLRLRYTHCRGQHPRRITRRNISLVSSHKTPSDPRYIQNNRMFQLELVLKNFTKLFFMDISFFFPKRGQSRQHESLHYSNWRVKCQTDACCRQTNANDSRLQEREDRWRPQGIEFL